MKSLNIPCPDCQFNIPIDSHRLLMGEQFSCPNCGISIGLAKEGKGKIEDAMDQFEKLKRSVEKRDDEGKP